MSNFHINVDYKSFCSSAVAVKLLVEANTALLDAPEIVAAIRGISTTGTNPA